MIKPEFFDADLAARADVVASDAIQALITRPAAITIQRRGYHVVVVNASAGAGKSYFICSVAERVVQAHAGETGIIAIATPTNDQAHSLVRSLAGRLPRAVVAFVPARNRNLPEDVRSLTNVVEITADEAHHYPVVVGTLDKFSDAFSRGNLRPDFRYLAIDEAYQANSGQYFGVAALADRHLLVGDPGQLDPFTTMEDADRWRGMAEDPLQTAVAVVLRNHPQIPVFRLPITRRLPSTAVPVVTSFYPGHTFGSWTRPGVRKMRLLPGAGRNAAAIDGMLDGAASSGWGYLRLPDSPVLTADPQTISAIRDIATRIRDRGTELSSESTGGAWERLNLARVAVAVSHNDQKDQLRVAMNASGLHDVRVDTANKLQGLEYDLVIAWHPLAGLPGPDGFHLDPGRLCVMLTRHRHACIVVGRVGDADIIESIPPSADAWIGYDSDPETDGWFAHRMVFDHLTRHAVNLN